MKRMTRPLFGFTLLLIAILLVGCFGGGGGGSSSYKLTVHVLDAEDDTPIQGAKVAVKGKSATTDKDGTVIITGIPGKVDIEVLAEGYKSSTKKDVSITKDSTETIKLTPSEDDKPDPDSTVVGVLEQVAEDGAEITVDGRDYEVSEDLGLRTYFDQLEQEILGSTVTIKLEDGRVVSLLKVELEAKQYAADTFTSLFDPSYPAGVSAVDFINSVEFVGQQTTSFAGEDSI